MYQVIVKGRTLEELKKAVCDINQELESGSLGGSVQKDLTVVAAQHVDKGKAVVEVAPTQEVSEDLDSEGIPWDKRIHASSKKQNADGRWKAKRGVELSLVDQVKAELGTTVTAVQTPVEVPPQNTAVQMPNFAIQNGHTLQTFTENFPMIISGLISTGKITQDYVNQLKSYFQVDEIWNVTPEQKAVMFQNFTEHKLITQVG